MSIQLLYRAVGPRFRDWMDVLTCNTVWQKRRNPSKNKDPWARENKREKNNPAHRYIYRVQINPRQKSNEEIELSKKTKQQSYYQLCYVVSRYIIYYISTRPCVSIYCHHSCSGMSLELRSSSGIKKSSLTTIEKHGRRYMNRKWI